MFDVGGKRAYRFSRYLHRYGWRTIVFTSQASRSAIDTTPIELPSEVTVIREYPAPRGRTRLSDGTVAAPVRDRSGMRSLFRSPVDRELWRVPRVVRSLRRLAASESIDCIMATSSPYSALVIGALLKRHTKLPLCLDLRDPWTLNFLHRERPAWVRSIDALAERRLLRYADRVVFTCESAAEAYRKHYPELPPDRIRAITNSFDPEQRPQPSGRPGPVRLVHFGNCYGGRKMAPVLRALAEVRTRRKLREDDLEILNLGRIAQSDSDLADALGLGSFLRHQPVVPYERGLDILAAADLQLLLAYGDETLFIPAKFFDYLLVGAPILCVSQASELTDRVEETGSGQWARPDDIEAIAGIIEQAIDARGSGSPIGSPRSDVIRSFSAPATAGQLASLLDELVTDPRKSPPDDR
jgi:hypothetical protein